MIVFFSGNASSAISFHDLYLHITTLSAVDNSPQSIPRYPMTLPRLCLASGEGGDRNGRPR
ncbi:hypothetical protein L195_g059702 [Trifolium pratense]|uniref:Uncharacterized protein n=1 Tax=Trifolium pratense TaxID=57577 RepID=A0A2K3JZL5_TRIPR|nr:hypothetical protein L195_g059702 [Trifolium pratense]